MPGRKKNVQPNVAGEKKEISFMCPANVQAIHFYYTHSYEDPTTSGQ